MRPSVYDPAESQTKKGWPVITLNDGTRCPSIAYGHVYWIDNDRIEPDVLTALEVGFVHLDTAQGYYDEDKFGSAIRRSGLKREDLYITTKYSRGSTDVRAACENSLKQLGVKQVDLYMPHDREAMGDEQTQRDKWAQFELMKKLGYTKSIGVSNYEIHQLKLLMAHATIPPSVNQIQFDPHSYAEMLPLVDYCAQHQILIEAYSPLELLRGDPGNPVVRVTTRIAYERKVQPEMIMMAWCKAKGVAVVTSSTKRERMESYLRAGEIELSPSEVSDIDAAGVESVMLKRAAAAVGLAGRNVRGWVQAGWPYVLAVLGLFGLWRVGQLWVGQS